MHFDIVGWEPAVHRKFESITNIQWLTGGYFWQMFVKRVPEVKWILKTMSSESRSVC